MKKLLILIFLLMIFISLCFSTDQSYYINVSVHSNSGPIYINSPSQTVTDSYIDFYFEPYSLPSNLKYHPFIIKIILPDGISLSQTLATGTPSTHYPAPDDVIVRNLPVCVNVNTYSLSNVKEDAVQLLRYVKGENYILIRITQSPGNWGIPDTAYFPFVRIGVPGNYWPTENYTSNWESINIDKKSPTTSFFLDVRNFNFTQTDYTIPLEFDYIYYQTINFYFSYKNSVLYYVRDFYSSYFNELFIGNNITDHCVVDVDKDNIPDIVSITNNGDLIINYLNEDKIAKDVKIIHVADEPLTSVVSGDINGDGDVEFIVSLLSGELLKISKDSYNKKEFDITPKITGQNITDSILLDTNSDGNYEFVYIDSTDNTLHILDNNLNDIETYTTSYSPGALNVGDINGDGLRDILIAENGSKNLAVLLNNGDNTFNMEEYELFSEFPAIDVDCGDFDRDGRDEVVVAKNTDQSIISAHFDENGELIPQSVAIIGFTVTPNGILCDNFDGLNGDDVLVGFSDYYQLALCTSDESGNLSLKYSIDTIGNYDVDQNGNVKLSENSILNINSGLSYGGINDRSGVAGIQENNLDIFFFPRSKDISLSLVNLGADDLLLNLNMFNYRGNIKGTNTVTINHGTQFASYFSEIFGSSANSTGNWVEGFSTSKNKFGMWLFNTQSQENYTYLDGGPILSASDIKTSAYIPVVYSGDKFTKIYFMNPFKEENSIHLELYDQFGNLKMSKNFLREGHGEATVNLHNFFNGQAEDGDYVKLSSDRGVIAYESFGKVNETLGVLPGFSTSKKSKTFYIPHVACNQFGGINYYTKIILLNPTDEEMSLKLYLYDDSGNILKSFPLLRISPHFKKELDVATIFGLGSETTTGYVKIESDEEIPLIGAVIFGDGESGKFISALPITTPTNEEYLMGHIAKGEIGGVNFFTGIAILNSSSNIRTVKISCYDKNGILLAEKEVTLNPQNRFVRILSEIFPELGTVAGGYIIVEDESYLDPGITVFQLFGDSELNFLSAVPSVGFDRN